MNVLIADDDPFFQKLLSKSLSAWGYETLTAADGQEAWALVSSPASPRIAILDYMMPNVDGLEVCRQIRAATFPHYVYIILLTARGKREDVAAGLKAGADDYLAKPVDLPELNLRLRAAVRVLEAEERHRVIAESALDGIVTFGADGCIQYANPVAASLFGYARADLSGLDFRRLVPDYSSDASTLSSTPEIPGLHSDGKSLILEASFSETAYCASERLTTVIIRDVTARRAEEARRAQARKMATIGELAGGLAQEIQTPIRYAGDNLRFIAQSFATLEDYLQASQAGAVATVSDDLDGPTGTANLAYMRKEAPVAILDALDGIDRVAEVVRALEEFSQADNHEISLADLNRVIDMAVLLSRHRRKDAASLHTDLQPNLPKVPCAAAEVSQAILSLIVKAADAQPGSIWVSSRSAGAFAEIRISYSGDSIPGAASGEAFDRAESDAYSIVARHRGTLEFETEPDKARTYVIRLPLERDTVEVGELVASNSECH